MSVEKSIYRLVGMDGQPHPVLDIQYESIDAAIGAAKQWNSTNGYDSVKCNRFIGIEVLTLNGTWRTILYS